MSDEELAAAYVLGLLEAEAREAARIRAVEDGSFAALVMAWERRMAPLALASEAPLPEGLLAKIEAAIAERGAELPGTVTLRAGGGEWMEASPGLHIKVLNRIDSVGRWTFMARLAPGAEYVEHDHDQDEEIYMIEGDLIIGDLVLNAGDFHVARAGRHHPVHRSRKGCLCIISQAAGPI
jgi:hypothetical protein